MRQLISYLAASLNEDRRIFQKLLGISPARPTIETAEPEFTGEMASGEAAEQRGDYVEAERLYKVAVQRGSVRALYQIGNLFASGTGRNRDLQEAERWYLLAAEKGDAYALHDLAMWNYFGIERPVNLEEAARLYQMSAEQGFEPAQNALLGLYEAHPELAHDKDAVFAFCQKAAEKGSPAAMLQLARAYRRGQWGIERNIPEAMKLYEAAGEKGVASAYYELGTMFKSGEGVPQNFQTAREWYEKAAASSLAPPEFLFDLGKLLIQMGDNVFAHAWLNLAASHPGSAQERPNYAEARDALAARMSPDEVLEAQRIASSKEGLFPPSTPTREVEGNGRRAHTAQYGRRPRQHGGTEFLTGVVVGSMISNDSAACPPSSSNDTGSYGGAESDVEAGGGDFGGGGASDDYGDSSDGD